MASKKTIDTDKIKSIFKSMEYGNPTDDDSVAKEWLKSHEKEVLGCFIANKHQQLADDVPTKELCNPSTGEKLAIIYDTKYAEKFLITDVDCEITSWTNLSNLRRSKILYSIARNIQKQQRLLSLVESMSTGRHISSVTNVDVPNLIRCAYQSVSVALLSNHKFDSYDYHFVLIFSDNDSSPIMSLCWKFMPLLAIGCRIVFYVTEDCCLSEFLFAEICRTSGLPDNALTIMLWNPNEFETLTLNRSFYKVFYQGDIPMGRDIFLKAFKYPSPIQYLPNKRLTAIVFESADKQSAVDAILEASHSAIATRHGCRLLVQESIYAEFIENLKTAFKRLRVGLFNDKLADMTCCITNTVEVDQLLSAITAAENENAQVLRSEKSYPVYLVTGVQPSSRIVQEQTKGVVIVVIPFRTTKEAIDLSNSTPGCDVLSVWSERQTITLEVSREVKASKIWINSVNHYDEPIENIQLLEEYLGVYLSPVNIDAAIENIGLTSVCQNPQYFSANQQIDTVDKTYKLYYGGIQKRPDGNTYYPILNNDSALIAYAPEASKKDVRNAVESARKAQNSWQKRSGHNKAQLLYYLAENLEQRKEEFSKLILKMDSIRKQIDAEAEIEKCIEELFKWAALADKNSGHVLNTPLSGLVVSIREPLGIIGIVCFNDLLDFVTLISAAICYGNTVIAIAPQLSPLAVLNFYQILDTSDIPPGVVNILCGNSDYLTRQLALHEDVNGLTYPHNFHDAKISVWLLANDSDEPKNLWIYDGDDIKDDVMHLKHSTKNKIIYTPGGETFAL